ncbi:PTS beta-glucoside transporter subunit EIIBCA [Raineyella fluvialis]|uniref:PTS beta-glucoside transporter subunit EIIBCA n=2 Tax=Raineyella fluvialis TaxID=2662261 RepID=A0A5Q2FD45_9ACTN|nr:PTS beta-glucoside transporter subunit EIIBCA [Raineyella fluvialis]
MDYTKTATEILAAVGGKGNITHVEHCSTRLRFTLADTSKADRPRLTAVPGVMGVVGDQPQVVVGNDVVEVHEALDRILGTGGRPASGPTDKSAAKPRWGAQVLDFIVGVFQPLIPAIAGAGVLKSLMLLATMFGLSKTDPTFTSLVAISDAVFFYLPLMVAVTTAMKLNSNRLVAMAAASVMVLPSMTAAIAKGTSVFGIPIPNITYSSQVFPAILCVLLLATLERVLTKVTPKPIRIFFVPMVALLITVPATLLFLGPLGFWAGTYFTQGVLWIYHTLGWVAFPLLAVALPFIISIGMHKAFIPYVVNQLSTAKSEMLYNPASLAHNIAEAGSSFGVALRTKDTEMRSTAVSAGISALFGITEPSLYGITIQNKRALWSVLSGAAAGATWLGVTHVSSYVAVGPGLASMSMFINADDPRNIVNAIVGAGIAFATAFVVSLFLWNDAVSVTLRARGAAPLKDVAPGDVLSPVDGEVVALSDVPDKVFAGGVVGQGFALRPASGEFRSPIAGRVTMLFDTHHAIGLTSDDGVELLLHVGLDTVRLGGKHFTMHVSKDDRVDAGQLLLSADLAAIEAAGYDTTTPLVVTNARKFDISGLTTGMMTKHGDPLFHVEKKGSSDAVVS